MTQKGFTIIELLVVVAVIAVLAAVSIPQYQRFTYKAMRVEPLQMLATIQKAQIAHMAVKGEYVWGNNIDFLQRLGLSETMISPHGWVLYPVTGFIDNMCINPGLPGTACGYAARYERDLDKKGFLEMPQYTDILRVSPNVKAYQTKKCPVEGQPYHLFDDILNRYVSQTCT